MEVIIIFVRIPIFLSYQFRGAIFNGLLCQIPNSSLGNRWRTSVGRFFSWSDLSMDVFANFRILLLAIFDEHVLRDFFVERSSSTKGGSVQELPSLVSLTERSSGFEVSPNRGHQHQRRPRIPLVHAPSQAKPSRLEAVLITRLATRIPFPTGRIQIQPFASPLLCSYVLMCVCLCF